MEIAKCTKADFDQIITKIAEFWGSDRTLHLHHPMLIYEFGNSAYVIKKEDKVVAYLFGLLSQTSPTGYVHLIAVHNAYRRQGLGRKLYEHFAMFAKEHGCKEIKAITSPDNLSSITFHKSIGLLPVGDSSTDSIPLIRDYSGPGKHRVVFLKPLE